MRITAIASVIALILGASPAWAESIDWALGKTIDLTLPVSTPEQVNSRTVVLPLAPVDGNGVMNFHDDADLDHQVRDNTITFRLKNPGFSGNIQVFDKAGNMFVFKVKAAARADTVDDTLFIRAAAATTAQTGSGSHGWPRDLRVASSVMLAHVFGDRQHPGIQSAPTDSLIEGKKEPYTIISQTDEYELRMIRAWSSPTITGVLCQLIVRSEKPITIDYRSIYPRNVVGIHAENQAVFDPINPLLQATPGQVVTIFYTMK